MSEQYTIRIDVDVYDRVALRKAAAKRAEQEDVTAQDWEALRASSYDPVALDLHMMFDPGASYDGTRIQETHAEFIDGELDDDAKIEAAKDAGYTVRKKRLGYSFRTPRGEDSTQTPYESEDAALLAAFEDME